jgi:hypothetical protein
MKKHLILALVTLSFLVTMNGCEKEVIPTPNPIINLLSDEEPQALVSELELTLTSPEVTDMNVGDALITDYPAFLDYDPFTVVMARTNSADSCLKGLEVTKAQKEQLSKAFLDLKLNVKKQIKKQLQEFTETLNIGLKYKKKTITKIGIWLKRINLTIR